MRLQLEIEQGGAVQADMPTPIDTGTGRVTIQRYNGTALEDAAVSAVVLPDPAFSLLLAGGAGASAGDREIVTVGLPVGSFPAKGSTVHLANAAGQAQAVRIRDVDATTQRIYTREPLTLSMAAGDSLKSALLTYTVTAANVPRNELNFRAVFSALAGGARITHEVIFDVGLRASHNPANSHDISGAWPDIHRGSVLAWLATGADVALLAGWDAVEASLFASGRNPNRLRDTTPLKVLIVNRALRFMARMGQVPAAWADELLDWLEELDDTYKSDLNTALAGVQWYDDDDDGEVDAGEDTPATFSIVLGR